MLQPKKPLDLSEANQILQSERKPLDLSSAEAILKKKESTELPSTAPMENTESVQKVGSLDGVGSNGFPAIDQNLGVPGLKPDLKTVEQLVKSVVDNKSKRVKELETSFYASTKDDNDDAVAEQRLQDRKANKGFWNTAEYLTKSAYNTVVDAVSASNPLFAGLQGAKISEDPLEEEKKQALLEAKKNKVTLSEDQKNARAEEIFKQKEKDNLFIDRANSYLDNLDVEDKDLLQQDRSDKAVHLQLENQKKFNVVSAMEIIGNEKIKEYQDVENQLLELKKNGQEFPKDLFDKYSNLGAEINQISGNIQKYSDQIQKNKSDLGTVKQEFDLFKRTYSDADNFIGNAIATTGELANGIFGAVNYFASLSPDPITRLNSMRGQKIASIISGSLEEYRGALRKPVESVESAEGFVNYASDLVANQLPILAVTSTGAGGLITLGASTTGQTFTKINQDVLSGKEKYSPLQMVAIPLLQGGFEVISEIPTLSILKKGSRVISAAANGEIDLIKKSGGEIFKGYAKDFGKEFGGEHITNLGQNFNARYVQGKEEVGLLDNTGRVSKDTAFLTTLLQGSPHVLGAVVKVFQSNQDFGTLDENSRKIIEFSKQLNTEGLTDTEKTVIQKQIDKVTAESSKIITNTIGKIGDMPNISYDEIISLNSQAGKIKAQAKEIKDGKLPNKEALLTSLGQDYKELQTKRNGLIDGSITPFDLLSGNEQTKRLTQASREITKRDNPDGTKEKFEVKPEDAKKLATENYLKEIKEKDIVDDKQVEQTPPTPEAQPQAEVQKPSESEKVKSELEHLDDYHKKILEDEKSYDWQKEMANEYFSDKRKSVQRSIDIAKKNLKENPDSGFDKETIRVKEEILRELDEQEKPKETPKPQEVSPVEDVVATSVEKPTDEQQFEDVKNGNVVSFTYENKSEIPEIFKDKISSEGEINGKKEIKVTIAKSLAEYHLQNEKSSSTNTPTNGNVQSRTSNVGESGITKQESLAKESVQSPNDVRASEAENEVNLEDIENFINETYLSDEKTSAKTETDQRAIEDSNKENREIPIVGKRKKQVKLTKEGKVSLQGRKSLSKRKFKGDRKTASEIDPTDAQSLALNYFVNGGKISTDYFKSKGERQARNNGINGIASVKAKNIDEIAHDIWESQENNGLKIDTEDIKNAIEEVVNGNLTVQDVVNTILKNYGLEKEDSVDYEKDYFNAIQEYQQEEDYSQEHIQEVESALDYLSDAEIIELANNQEKEFEDYIKDLESRQVTYDLGAFSERGTIQPDGWILSENGELLSPQSVRNVKQVNPYIEVGILSEFGNIGKEGVVTLLKAIKAQLSMESGGVGKPFGVNIWTNEQGEIKYVGNNAKRSKGLIQNTFAFDLNDNLLKEKSIINSKEALKAVEEVISNIPEKLEVKTPISKDTPELKEVNAKLEKANENLRIAKEALDRKAKSLDKELVKDNEDIFGERKNQNENKLFDERVDGNARNKATEKERKAIKDAQDEIKALTEAKAKIESGEIVSTKEMDFDAKQQLKDKVNAEVDTDLVSKEYYEKFQKDFPNTLLAIEEKNGLITIFENGETREVQDYEFVKELKNALAKGYKGIGKVTRKVVDTETKKLRANAEVDRIAQKIKDILPGIDDPDLNKQGISQDDLIDLVASAVKTLVSKGIDINDAIRQVISSIKERFNVDVDEKLVKEKLGVEKPQDFESKAGKKSVLNRMASGNSSVIKKAIAKYSLDYEIENQKEAKSKAEMFVDEVGVDNALIAVRKGLIDGAQGAFIYARAIEVLEQQINDLKGEDKLDAIADYQELLGQISDELDNRSRSNGRFIAALAEIYNSSNGRYNLKKMVNDYKAANNGNISKEVLEKLKNVEEKLKESEAKLAELEAKKRVEEENEAFNNILEAVARKKRINTNAKISDKQKAKAFADKLRSFKISNNANLSAATPFSIAYDLAIETAAKAIEVSGLVSDAIKAGVNSIRNSKLSKDEQEQALSDLFDLFDDSDVNTGQKGMMSIDQEGKLRIPHSLIREKVENGVDNIDDLVSELMSDAQELFPDLDFTERQIRDIVTGYGKVSNPTTDEIETQISIMKSLGKIASGLEDAYKGQRPLRSGQQRREPTVKERTEMKKLKALLRDLPLADADIKKAYKTALEAIKKRLSNEIEELDEQIANGEKRKGQKSVIEYDQEAKDLKAERDAKKALLDEMVGKPELTEQQKIDRAEKTLQKRLDDLQQKIDNSEIDYAKKAESVTSAKLEEMRKLKKELESQIQKMREDSGLAEARLIDIAKRNASKRLAALKERIANGDFEKRKRKPTPTDVELNKIKSEIAQQKEIFDKEVYKLELKNRRIEQKALDVLKDILSIPKILSFTADLSFVGIQNVTQVYKMGANSLIHLAKTGKLKGTFRDAMAKTFKAMASPDFEQKFMQAVKANPNYQLWKDSRLGIVESHYKESAKAEVFQHNALSTLFDILGNYVASKGYEKAGDIIKNYVNIISIFERGQTVFENQMRINRFQEGVDLLKAQGLNPIDDIQEYRKVAAAVNTLTGRANTGSKVASALREANGTLFSSFSNWAAGVNQLNPYWYYTLTPTARKMALTDVAHHIIGAGSMISMAALYALGQDDDDEDKVTIETDPTSSDFAVIKIGNLRIDPWAGKKTTVVAFSRLLNGGKTDKYGNFKKYGVEYDDEDWIDLPLEYAGNKIAPGPRFAIDRFFKTKKVEYKGQTFREDKYGVDFKESKYLIPLIFENFREVNEEQPNLFGKATMALSWTGLINTNVYGGMKEGFKDMPDDLIEKEYKVKIQKIKDNEKILESNIDKLAKEYNEKKITKNQILQKVDSLVNGDGELFNKSIESIVAKVNKEELKTLVDDPFYLGLKKENNPEIQAILFYSKFKDDSRMSYKEKKERDRNLRYIEFDATNPRFIKAYRELLNSKNKPVN